MQSQKSRPDPVVLGHTETTEITEREASKIINLWVLWVLCGIIKKAQIARMNTDFGSCVNVGLGYDFCALFRFVLAIAFFILLIFEYLESLL